MEGGGAEGEEAFYFVGGEGGYRELVGPPDADWTYFREGGELGGVVHVLESGEVGGAVKCLGSGRILAGVHGQEVGLEGESRATGGREGGEERGADRCQHAVLVEPEA